MVQAIARAVDGMMKDSTAINYQLLHQPCLDSMTLKHINTVSLCQRLFLIVIIVIFVNYWIGLYCLSYDTPNVTLNTHRNETHVPSNVCSFYLIKNKNPNWANYHFFHDMECILSALHFQHFSSDCTDINMIVSDRFNYGKSVYSQLFNFTMMDRNAFNNYTRKVENKYGCQHGKEFRTTMAVFRRYIIKRFKLDNIYKMGYDSREFYKDYGDVLIINRNKHRHIHNANELFERLQIEFTKTSHRVRMVYFDKMPLLQQYECVLNASVLITPHGAAEIHLMMVNPVFGNRIKVIELCPPYTHCFVTKQEGPRNANLCPYYYQKAFKQVYIYGVGREDQRLGNCSVFWKEHNRFVENQRAVNKRFQARNFIIDFKRINGFKVDVGEVLAAVKDETLVNRMYIDRTMFGETEFMFYKSTKSLVDKQKREVFELYPEINK
eukprot:287461_1